MDYGTRAKENFLNGYNCCQAVFLACTDELGLDTETRAKIASSFGGGMGGMRQVCGAVSGMLMALGLHQGYTDPKDKAGKAAQYEVIRALADEFKRENGSIICRELLGKLQEVISTGANDVFYVKGAHEYMIPAVPEFVLERNIDEGFIRVRLIEGMQTDAL